MKFSCVKPLIANGAKINAKDFSGLTALHYACAKGNTSVVEDLLAVFSLDIEVSKTTCHFCIYLSIA